MFKPHFLKDKKNSKIHWNDQLATIKIADQLLSYLPKDYLKPIVFICIGTDRSTGDSLGPFVGTELSEMVLPSNFYIHGTLEEPIHAVNLQEKLDEIKNMYKEPYIIAIDACLGHSHHIGSIQIKRGPLKPGAGVNKTLPQVGDIHITGIVNMSGFMEFFVLQNTRLHLVINIAKSISGGIYRTGLLYQSVQTDYFISEDEKNTI